MKRRSLLNSAVMLFGIVLTLAPLALAGPLQPKRPLPEPRFNRLHHNDEIFDALRGYAAAYPAWATLESIGKSSQGNDMWLFTINNPVTGRALDKPAMYVDGSTHANEVQGAETVFYLIDYMLKNYGKLPRLTTLMDRAAFYFVPVVSPDSRAQWFDAPSTRDWPRSVQVAIDDDRDGLADEDGYDDLNGDGLITQMRLKVPPGQGRFRLDPDDPRILIPADENHPGDYNLLGLEGIDNDGDGRINEDGIGYVDPNRTWGYEWQPRYVQMGAPDYPLQIPETRAIALWAEAHKNIAAAQSFHNSGGMILRGPGSKTQPRYPMSDLRVYDKIGEMGETMLPGYGYMITWKDLYTAYGTTDDHFFGRIGAFAITNELYREEHKDADGDGKVTDEERMSFNDLMTLGRMFVDWQEVEHPQYGAVEVGGWRRDTGRIPEGWMLEEECHRNAAFVLYHARQLPFLEFGEPKIRNLGNGIRRLEVPLYNRRTIASRPAVAQRLKIVRKDVVTLQGAVVLASGMVENSWLNLVELQKKRPERLLVDAVPGEGFVTLFFLVEGGGQVRLQYDSVKGGRISREIDLE